MLRKLSISAAVSALAVMAMTGAAEAQDWRLNPTYGGVTLSSGYTPDPYLVNLQSGGSINASQSIGGNCRGYVANAPDFRLQYRAGNILPLIISVSSSSDTTLVINAPDGRWYCDDDGGQGLNPSLRWNSPMSGQYDIYVGTYGSASYRNATLSISELSSY
ncbi:peptidase S1 [Hyphobacterium sp. HN65]|uniref:Peptidase S1 n=1 Tax=Hyphobacterium lacteum TaxID=3116575 RepID=A0ABU7LVG2_9PROT|nr:peptidase S1 [Hyphobacterium sp. HN65]MEE2527324.1 peptidase S1 [Hyphobacterium sp. HN65]